MNIAACLCIKNVVKVRTNHNKHLLEAPNRSLNVAGGKTAQNLSMNHRGNILTSILKSKVCRVRLSRRQIQEKSVNVNKNIFSFTVLIPSHLTLPFKFCFFRIKPGKSVHFVVKYQLLSGFYSVDYFRTVFKVS